MKLKFNPEVSMGNIGSACVALIVAGGVLSQIGTLQKNQETATTERLQLRSEIVELDKKLERVLVLIEERTRPALAGKPRVRED